MLTRMEKLNFVKIDLLLWCCFLEKINFVNQMRIAPISERRDFHGMI